MKTLVFDLSSTDYTSVEVFIKGLGEVVLLILGIVTQSGFFQIGTLLNFAGMTAAMTGGTEELAAPYCSYPVGSGTKETINIEDKI